MIPRKNHNSSSLDLGLNFNYDERKNKRSVDFNDLKYLRENFVKNIDKNNLKNNVNPLKANCAGSFFVFGKNSKQTNFNKNSLENQEQEKSSEKLKEIKRVNSVVKSTAIKSMENSYNILPQINLQNKRVENNSNTEKQLRGSPLRIPSNYKKLLQHKIKLNTKQKIGKLGLVPSTDRCNTETERKLYKYLLIITL